MNVDPKIAQQHCNNRQTVDAWSRFTSHRQQLMDLVADALPPPSGSPQTIGVFGAGNCNDLNLSWLTQRFAKTILIDLDLEAVEQGVLRQQFLDNRLNTGRIEVIAPVDIASIHENMPQLLFNESEHNESLGGTYDVALSAGLFTQIVQSILGDKVPTVESLQRLIFARRRHFELLFKSIKRPGAAVFVTDIVSSLTAPDLDSCEPSQLPKRLEELIAQRNFFTGANPQAILTELRQSTEITGGLASIQTHSPWLWPVVPGKTFLMWGVTVRLG